MRFSRQHRPRNNGDESILPLTNVVFLLLIFFMLAGQITAPMPFEVDPPLSVSEANAEAGAIEVQIGSGGALAIDGEPTTLDALTGAVRDKLSQDDTRALRVRADGGGDATRVVSVMHALRDAGATRLRLITVVADSP